MDTPVGAIVERKTLDNEFVEVIWGKVREGQSTTQPTTTWSRDEFDAQVERACEEAYLFHPNSNLVLQEYCRDLELWKHFGLGRFPDWHPFVSKFIDSEKAESQSKTSTSLIARLKWSRSARTPPPRHKDPHCSSPATYERLSCLDIEDHEKHYELTKNYTAKDVEKIMTRMRTEDPTFELPQTIATKMSVEPGLFEPAHDFEVAPQLSETHVNTRIAAHDPTVELPPKVMGEAEINEVASTYEVRPAVSERNKVKERMDQSATASFTRHRLQYSDMNEFPPLAPIAKVNTEAYTPTGSGMPGKRGGRRHRPKSTAQKNAAQL